MKLAVDLFLSSALLLQPAFSLKFWAPSFSVFNAKREACLSPVTSGFLSNFVLARGALGIIRPTRYFSNHRINSTNNCGVTMSNPRVFFKITINKVPAGTLEMELYKDVVPNTAENFRCLCTGEKGKGMSGKPLWFKGARFHRIIPQFMCQGGDITRMNGTGGESIYGASFADENFIAKHSEPFLLSMANAGPGTNNSQFFITTAECPWLDGKHVVFGKVVSGLDVVRKIEQQGRYSGDPKALVEIADCGQIL